MSKKFFILSLCVVFIGCFVSFLPHLFSSTSWGKELLLKFFNDRIQGSISAEELQIHWLGDQQLKQVVWRSSDDQMLLQCETLAVDMSLLQFLRFYCHQQVQGTMTIQNLTSSPLSSNESSVLNHFKTKYRLAKFPQNLQLSAHCSLNHSGIVCLKDFTLYAWFPNVSKPMHIYLDSLDLPLLK